VKRVGWKAIQALKFLPQYRTKDPTAAASGVDRNATRQPGMRIVSIVGPVLKKRWNCGAGPGTHGVPKYHSQGATQREARPIAVRVAAMIQAALRCRAGIWMRQIALLRAHNVPQRWFQVVEESGLSDQYSASVSKMLRVCYLHRSTSARAVGEFESENGNLPCAHAPREL
jgi:hypothetical protein